MSPRSICVGDFVRKVTFTGGTFGNSPTSAEGSPIECRIDINAVGEDRETGVPDGVKTGMAFFAANPNVAVGHHLRWLSNGGIAVSPAIVFKVTGVDAEGPPGKTPYTWNVSLESDSQVTSMIRSL